MNLETKLLQLKAQFADALLSVTNEKALMENKVEEYRNILIQIMDLLKLDDPTVDQLITKITSLTKFKENNTNMDAPRIKEVPNEDS